MFIYTTHVHFSFYSFLLLSRCTLLAVSAMPEKKEEKVVTYFLLLYSLHEMRTLITCHYDSDPCPIAF